MDVTEKGWKVRFYDHNGEEKQATITLMWTPEMLNLRVTGTDETLGSVPHYQSGMSSYYFKYPNEA